MDLRRTEVLPLYARLSAAEQHRVFASHTGRRIVLATNVAETSLTVPGIRYVIDTGTARISRYSARTKVQRLPIEPISQASANQRAGRCGRVAPGVCIRLYDEEDYVSRPDFTEPEILRTNLASVILQMTAADLGDDRLLPVRGGAGPQLRSPTVCGCSDELGALSSGLGASAASADQDRPTTGPDPGRPPDGPDAARRGAAGLPGRRCMMLVAGLSVVGSPRAPGRAAGQGRCAAPALLVDDARQRRRAEFGGARPFDRLRARAKAQGRRGQGTGDPKSGGLRADPGRQRLPGLLRLWDYVQDAAESGCPATPSGGCVATSTCTSCGSGSGRTCTRSCARSAEISG